MATDERRDAILQTRQAGGSGTVSAATSAPGTSHFSDRGGTVLPAVNVQLVYWGGAWAAGGSPTPDEVTAAFGAVMSGPYMSALAQYRGIGNATLAGTTVVADSEPPNGFSNDSVTALLKQLFEQKRLPEPDSASQLLYCVVPVAGTSAKDPNVLGEHSYFHFWEVELPFDLDIAQKTYYAWLLNDGTVDGMSTIFSHELVESVSDPEGNAILGDSPSCYGGGWCEIGDVCQGNTGMSNGVTVQAYWSQTDSACVIPT
jgi:hypothetical protein